MVTDMGRTCGELGAAQQSALRGTRRGRLPTLMVLYPEPWRKVKRRQVADAAPRRCRGIKAPTGESGGFTCYGIGIASLARQEVFAWG